jgi:hypothetical protein
VVSASTRRIWLVPASLLPWRQFRWPAGPGSCLAGLATLRNTHPVVKVLASDQIAEFVRT